MRDRFTPTELQLPYPEWVGVATGSMAPGLQAWLAKWNLLDLAWSPMDDNRRRLLRYGHYLGWFDRGQG